MAGKIIAEIWLDLVPKNGGPGSGPGNGADNGGASNTTSQGLNDGVIIDQEGGGITFLGAGSIKGGKTDYDVGQGFWLGFDTSDQYYKVAIGDPNGDTFNWDGEEINSKMNNLELRGWLRGPAEFVIDPAAHGDETGEVVIAGDMEIQGSTLQVPNDFTIDPATHGDDTGNLIIAGNLEVAGGTITGPATIVIDPAAVGANSGLVQILGDLQVDGLTTTINSSVMTVDDKNVVIGEGATNAAAVNLGGFTLEGANATILYTASDDKWNLNKGLNITGDLEATGDITAGGALEGQSLDIGSGSLTVNSGGDLVTQGSLTVAGVSSLDGNVELGDSSTDLITFNGLVNSHIIPQTHNLYDLGSTDLRWRTLYVEDIFADTIDVGDGDFAVDTDGNVDANSIDLGFAAIDENGNATFATLTLGSATQGYILKQVNAPTSALSFVNHTTMELNNVDSTAPTNATVLKYNSTNSQYESVDFKTTSLEDVSTTTATDNQILKYNFANTQYEPVDHNTRQLEDVSNTAPTNDQILQYNSTTSKYEPQNFVLDSLVDVVIVDVSQDDLLVYQSTTNDWRNKNKAGAGFATVASTGSYNDLSNKPDVYTKTELNNGQLDNRYYTETELNAGQLDNRYYTETEVNALLYSDSDVDSHLNVSSALPAMILTWNGSDYVWADVASAGAAGELDELDDVTIGTLANKDILVYNSTSSNFENSAFSAFNLGDLGDVDTTGSNNLKVLKYNGSSGNWVPDTIAFSELAVRPTTLAGYGITDAYTQTYIDGIVYDDSDVDAHLNISSAGTNSVLLWNGTDYTWSTSSSSVALSLGQLSDVSLATLSTNEYLKYDGSAWVDSVIDWTHIANKPTILTTADLYTDGDVDTHLNRSSAGTNQVLTWNGSDYAWTTPSTGNSNVQDLDDLNDVTISTPTTGEVLRYDGTRFRDASLNFGDLGTTPTTLSGYGIANAYTKTEVDNAIAAVSGSTKLTDLQDVYAAPATGGEMLYYNGTANEWQVQDNTLNNHNDVSLSGVNNGHVLKYSSTSTAWVNDAFTLSDLSNMRNTGDGDVDSPSTSQTNLQTSGTNSTFLVWTGSDWAASRVELDDLYGIGDPLASSASQGDCLVLNQVSHPQTYSWEARTSLSSFSASSGIDYNSTTGEFTADQAEIRGFFSAGGDLSYNSTTGVMSFTERTDAEVRALISAGGDLSYNSTTGVMSFTERTDTEVRGLLSVSTAAASGGGSLSYANTTGVFTYTPPDLSSTLTTSSSIADLSDVDSLVTSGASNKDVLWYNTTSGEWENTAPANIASAISLSNLSDVSSTAATGGQVLTWNGTNSEWEAVTPYGSSNFDTNFASKSIKDLSDVFNYTAVNNGDLLKWNSAASRWSPGTLDTDVVSEGSTNLYYTDARVQTKLGAVSGSIIPNANETYDLGSSTYKFRDLYLSGNTLTLGTLSISDSSGALNVTSGGSPAKFSSVGITDNATSTAITIDSSQNVTVNGNLSATKLTALNGTLELDDNGTHNGIINVPASLFLNLDSDNTNTGEYFAIAKDRSSTSGGTELFRVQEDGNVGIGETSPSAILHISVADHTQGSDGRAVRIDNDTSGRFGVIGVDDLQNMYLWNGTNNGTGTIQFYTGGGTGTERMRIDSSGNLFVGTTVLTDVSSSGTGNEGAYIKSDGSVGLATSNDKSLIINRKTTDGDLVEFRKDGTTVGSIASLGGAGLRINSQGATGILRNGGSDKYTWSDSAFASANDNYRDLGSASYRWKDLYLAGGAYLGGTAAANKLDDYEEGTFTVTPTFATSGSATLSRDLLSYTKIGQVVYITGQIQFNVLSSPTGTLSINIPFAAKSPVGSDRETNSFFVGKFQSLNAAPPTGSDGDDFWVSPDGSTITLQFYNGYTNTATALDSTYLKSGTRLTITGWYLAA